MHGLTILGLFSVSRTTHTRVSLGWNLRSMELVFIRHDAPHLIKGLVLIQVQPSNEVLVGSPFRRLRIPDLTVLSGSIGL